ncbi:mCG145005, partial [Mus musculus]
GISSCHQHVQSNIPSLTRKKTVDTEVSDLCLNKCTLSHPHTKYTNPFPSSKPTRFHPIITATSSKPGPSW